jgi:hypothetical protein
MDWNAQTVNYCDQIRSVFNDFSAIFFTSVTATFCLYLASFLSERVFTATAVHLYILPDLYSPNGNSHLDHNASIIADFLKEVNFWGVENCKENFKGQISPKN